ncbi:MAG: DUF2254 family protein [Polyangiaceae bacterium]
MERFDPSSWRKWIVPMTAISSVALVAFAALYGLDKAVTQGHPPGKSLVEYLLFDPGMITDAVPALGGMIAAVLGIVITVVSIVVQLSASRFHGVANMFLRDRTNLGVMGFYVVACVCGVLVSLSLRPDFVPRLTVVGMMLATTMGLVLMAPYFAYVFWFLEPTNIIGRIRSEAVSTTKSGSTHKDDRRAEEAQARVVSSMEELTDISSNSISGKDKIIASRAVDALKDFAVDYVRTLKPHAGSSWFELGRGIRQNPDFVAMEAESRRDLVERKTWVEWKVMRQYLGIYSEALNTMPDINYLIAIDTRYIGEAAAETNDDELIELTFRFMNSYLRATLNAKNVRTAYNVFNQYRQLVESMMRHGHGKWAATAVGHMKYYGHVSYDMNLSFVTETVAYDMGTLCEVAHQLELPEHDEILDTFLQLDRDTARKSEERALKGVRKAQTKLAAYYLMVGERDKARLIYLDMEHDPPDRLEAIKDELERVETKDFWEIIDRGRNFEYMPPKQKKAMRRFFTWFDGIDSLAMRESQVPAAVEEASSGPSTSPSGAALVADDDPKGEVTPTSPAAEGPNSVAPTSAVSGTDEEKAPHTPKVATGE